MYKIQPQCAEVCLQVENEQVFPYRECRRLKGWSTKKFIALEIYKKQLLWPENHWFTKPD